MGFPTLYTATKIDRQTFVHVEVHKITMPSYGDRGWYVQGLSLSAFAHNGDKDRNKGNWSPAYLYVVKPWDEFVEDAERWKERYERVTYKSFDHLDDRLLPTFEHASIWEFYKHEGYDYKKKKWVK